VSSVVPRYDEAVVLRPVRRERGHIVNPHWNLGGCRKARARSRVLPRPIHFHRRGIRSRGRLGLIANERADGVRGEARTSC
jgi:hypothetical protein